MCLWEEQWLACSHRLNQWEVLVDFGRSVENYDILLDTLWKVSEWQNLKDTVLPKAQVEESPKFRMVQAYAALNENSLSSVNEADMRVGQGVELALHQWWQLPEMAVQSHIPLLEQFQQLVELQESARVLLEIGNGNKAPSQGSGQLVGVQVALHCNFCYVVEKCASFQTLASYPHSCKPKKLYTDCRVQQGHTWT
jgi:transformation/transcription domain-associated protein